MPTKPSRKSNLKSLAQDNKEEIEMLQKHVAIVSQTFHLVASASHPGSQSGNVIASLQWLDRQHTESMARLKVIAPPEEKKEESVVTEPAETEANA